MLIFELIIIKALSCQQSSYSSGVVILRLGPRHGVRSSHLNIPRHSWTGYQVTPVFLARLLCFVDHHTFVVFGRQPLINSSSIINTTLNRSFLFLFNKSSQVERSPNRFFCCQQTTTSFWWVQTEQLQERPWSNSLACVFQNFGVPVTLYPGHLSISCQHQFWLLQLQQWSINDTI